MCDCNQNTDPCAQAPCVPTETCDCPVKDLKSDCIIFTADLNCTNIKAGLTLTETLVGVDSAICDIKDEILNNIGNLTTIVNVGLGKKVYKGTDTLGRKQLRTIDKTGNLITVTENINTVDISIDETVLTDFIKTNQKSYDINNVGTGTKIYQEPDPTPVGNTTTFNLKSLKSNTLQITSTEDEIIINSMDNDFRYLTSFYVNSNYTPTVNSPADGSIIRPFPTWEEAKTAFIGTGTIQQPEFDGSIIILQTSATATTNPTVNRLIVRFENSSVLTYTGTDLYMFDTEILYPLVPKNTPRNDLQYDIVIKLIGKGTITRTAGIGLVRGMGTNRPGSPAQLNDKQCFIQLGSSDNDNIALVERSSYPSNTWEAPNGGFTTLTDGVTTLESFYGTPHRYSTLLNPTTPLIYLQYESGTPFTYGVRVFGDLFIQSLANVAVRVVGNTIFGGSGNLKLSLNGTYISALDGTKVTGMPFNYGYKPPVGKNLIEGLNGGVIYFPMIKIEDKAGYSVSSLDNLFKFTGNGYIAYGDLDLSANFYINKLFDLSDVSNTSTGFTIANTLQGSKIDLPNLNYFIDTNQSTFTLYMPNTVVKTFLNKSVNPVTINTDTLGTLSSFKGVPLISGISNYANDAAATTAGLIKNSLYFNTTTNAVDIT